MAPRSLHVPLLFQVLFPRSCTIINMAKSFLELPRAVQMIIFVQFAVIGDRLCVEARVAGSNGDELLADYRLCRAHKHTGNE